MFETIHTVPEEMLKLICLLRAAGIQHEVTAMVICGEASIQISAPNRKSKIVDAVCNFLSQGGKSGLLEVMGSANPDAPNEDVVGWLTAADALKYFINPKEEQK